MVGEAHQGAPGKGKSKVGPNEPTLKKPIVRATDQAAKAAGISRAKVEKAEAVKKAGKGRPIGSGPNEPHPMDNAKLWQADQQRKAIRATDQAAKAVGVSRARMSTTVDTGQAMGLGLRHRKRAAPEYGARTPP